MVFRFGFGAFSVLGSKGAKKKYIPACSASGWSSSCTDLSYKKKKSRLEKDQVMRHVYQNYENLCLLLGHVLSTSRSRPCRFSLDRMLSSTS